MMITVSDLKKSYGTTAALNGISFTIQKGEFFGLLGPNGAGKTTTISIMSTILPPTGGTVTINGHDVVKDPMACKRLIGVVPQEIALYSNMSAYDNLLFWGSLYDVPRKELEARIDETLSLFGLSERKHDKISTYSGGMKRRINIASALLHCPQVLFMDEPTVGVDPQSRNLIFEVVKKLHKEGMTIVYTTHYMEEAERLCDRIAIIDNGSIVAQGSLQELRKLSAKKEMIAVTLLNFDEKQQAQLKQTWPDVSFTGQTLKLQSVNVNKDLPGLITACTLEGLDIQHVEIEKVNLETIFLDLTGKQLRD